jgi:CubicO group peptidase (beta-lactamase class C family)
MARYLAFLTDTGRGSAREHYGTILSRSSLEEMWQEMIPVGESGGLRESMGLCFFLEDYGGQLFVGHTGSQKAFLSFFYIHPGTGTGAIAAFNSDGAGGDTPRRLDTRSILNGFREALFRDVFPVVYGG